jgi:hypothetical protein
VKVGALCAARYGSGAIGSKKTRMTSVAIVLAVALAQADAGVPSWRDVAHLDELGRKFDTAVLSKNTKLQAGIEAELHKLLKQELDATRGRADADEATLKREKPLSDGGVNTRRQDARQDLRIGGRLFEIDNELVPLEGKMDSTSSGKKRRLIDELIGLAEQERRREGREKKLDEK